MTVETILLLRRRRRTERVRYFLGRLVRPSSDELPVQRRPRKAGQLSPDASDCLTGRSDQVGQLHRHRVVAIVCDPIEQVAEKMDLVGEFAEVLSVPAGLASCRRSRQSDTHHAAIMPG